MVPERSTQTIRRGNRGIRQARKLTVALLAALTLAGSASAATLTVTVEARGVFTNKELGAALGTAFDLTVARPLGVGRIVFGIACFIPAAIFAEPPPLLGWDSKRWRSTVGDAWQTFVGDQFEATFMTPLGQFEEEY